ncbi:MAG TPA: hypothetical protein VJZ26_14050 [Blastocatellia bacterium]|nr:hypothetical protein [Blastocatellia bacterium]
MSRPRPRAAMRRPRAGALSTPKKPTPRSVVGIIEWEEKIYTLAEMRQSPPSGGGIYIIARPVKINTPVTAINKPIIPIYIGEAGDFRERWTKRWETLGHLFGDNADSVLNAPPFTSFGVYIGKFPAHDVGYFNPLQLRRHREDVEWVLIRYLTQRRGYRLNQVRKVTEAILSEAQGIRITNAGTRPEFLEQTIEVAPGSTLELAMNELSAETWEVAWGDKGASPGGRWFRQGRNIVVLLDA